MASVGHISVGMAAARIYHHGQTPRWSSLASWSALSLLPDADVVGFALGIDYADPWGHRGATHSFVLSVVIGLAIGFGARWLKQPAGRAVLFATAVLASHGILDTMTDGGLGCALLWPFDLARYFAPWRPIPVAPIGPDFISSEGVIVALTELVLFGPVLIFALQFPKIATKRAALSLLLPLWLVSVWLISSGDPARESIVGFILREDTAYTSAFSEKAFRTIKHGDSDKDVRRLLGAPMKESWLYTAGHQTFEPAMERSAASVRGECVAVNFDAGVVVSALDPDTCRQRGIQTGMSPVDVERRLGPPPERDWQYSWSPRGARHRMRMVYFTNDRVAMVIRRWN